MKKFYDKYSREEIFTALNNKFLLVYKCKIDNPIYISSKYGIIMRNINDIELDVLPDSIAAKAYRILSLLYYLFFFFFFLLHNLILFYALKHQEL